MNLFSESNKFWLITLCFIFNILYMYVVYAITFLSDVCFVAIVGWFFAKLCGMNLKMIGAIELAIYSLTLSIVLSAFHSCATVLFGFRIEYFNIIYLLIAYVYLIAALFIIRDDLMKRQEELNEVYEAEVEIRKELNETEESDEPVEDDNKDEEQNDSEEEKDSDNETEEPDGSEI